MFYGFRHRLEMKRLLKNGLKVGKHALIFNGEEDYGCNAGMVSIGNNCVIASGVKFITNPGIGRYGYHRGKKSENLPSGTGIIIHDNCFIGINAMVYPDVEIGPNTVVGAGAVVMDNIQPERCAAGNPAQVTCTLQFYTRVCNRNQPIQYNHDTKRSVLQQFFWTGRDKAVCGKSRDYDPHASTNA